MSGDIPLLSPYEILKFYLAGRTNQQIQPEGLNYAPRATPTSTTGGDHKTPQSKEILPGKKILNLQSI